MAGAWRARQAGSRPEVVKATGRAHGTASARVRVPAALRGVCGRRVIVGHGSPRLAPVVVTVQGSAGEGSGKLGRGAGQGGAVEGRHHREGGPEPAIPTKPSGTLNRTAGHWGPCRPCRPGPSTLGRSLRAAWRAQRCTAHRQQGQRLRRPQVASARLSPNGGPGALDRRPGHPAWHLTAIGEQSWPSWRGGQGGRGGGLPRPGQARPRRLALPCLRPRGYAGLRRAPPGSRSARSHGPPASCLARTGRSSFDSNWISVD